MFEKQVKSEISLVKVSGNDGRLKTAKQVGCGSPQDATDASQVRSQSSCEQRCEQLPTVKTVEKSRKVTFVPVISKAGKVLMPTTPARARELIKKGKAIKQFRVGIFFIKLVERENGDVQQVGLGIDPGSKREAYTVKSKYHTYLNVLSNAVDWVKRAVETRRMMRKNRRINTPYRKNKFNRKRNCFPPSTKSRWQLKLRISKILLKLYPLTDFVVEDIKARTIKNARKWNINFSPLMVGKIWFYKEIEKLGMLHIKSGWETKLLRDRYGLKKTNNKLKEVFSAHNVDSFVLVNSIIGGTIKPDNTTILKLDPIKFHRRQLHRLIPKTGNIRSIYGGTISLGYKKGGIVIHPKYGFCYIGGNANGKISLHNICDGERLTTKADRNSFNFLTYNSFKSKFIG